MITYFCLTFIFLIVCSVATIPLNNCLTSNVDILFLTDKADDRYNSDTVSRLANIVRIFQQMRQNNTAKMRVAVLEASTSIPLLTFEEYEALNSTEEMKDKVNSRIQGKLIKNTVVSEKQLIHFWKKHTSENSEKITFYLKEKNIPMLENVYIESLLTSDTINLFVITNSIVKDDQIHLLHRSVIPIGPNLNIQDMHLIHMKVCGQCMNGWVGFKSKKKPFIYSCFKVIKRETAIDSFMAESQCLELKSSLLNVQTQEKLDFLMSVFSKHLTDKTNKTYRIPLLYRFKLNEHPLGYLWENKNQFFIGSPFIVKNIFYETQCAALELINELKNISRELKWNWTINDCLANFIDIVVCEFAILLNVSFHDDIRTELDMRNDSVATVIGNKRFSFECKFKDQHIHFFKVCDGNVDCLNGRDELVCLNKAKRFLEYEYEFHHKSIDENKDNTECENDIRPHFCWECLEKMCPYNMCLPNQWFTVFDCPFVDLPLENVICIDKKCDITFEPVICSASEYAKDGDIHLAPKCIYIRSRMGYPLGCSDLSHLEDCEHFKCPNDMIKCPHSYCILSQYVGDGVSDCRYGEDEAYLFQVSDSGLKECLGKKESGKLIVMCNGKTECENSSDEKLCLLRCPSGFICEDGVMTQNENKSIDVVSEVVVVPKTIKAIMFSDLNLRKIRLNFLSPVIFEINLFNCSISQDLSNYLIYQVKKFQFTYQVDLSYNNITEIKTWGLLYEFTNLQYLNLSHNLYLHTVENNSLTSTILRVFDFSYTRISFLHEVMFHSPYLEFVNLSHTKISSLNWLPYGVRLSTLDLTNTEINMKSVNTNVYNDLFIEDQLFVSNYKLCCPIILGPKISRHECHSPPDPISSCNDLIGDKTKRVLFLIVTSLAFIGNFIVLVYRFTIDRKILKRAYGVFIVNLTLSDLIMAFYLAIIAYTDIIYRNNFVINSAEWENSRTCQSLGLLSFLSCETSTVFELLITGERYLSIKYPFKSYFFTKCKVILTVSIVWLICFLLSLLPIIVTDLELYSNNSMCVGVPIVHSNSPGWSYAISIFIMLNTLIFCMIALGQIAIFVTATKGKRSLVQSPISRKTDVDLAKQLILIACSNLVSFVPVIGLGLASMSGASVDVESYVWVVIFVLPLHSAVNPYIYTVPFIYKKWQEFRKGKSMSIELRRL